MNQNVVCFGEILLRLSAPGKELLLQTGGLDVHVGGAEANVAVALSRLGHATAVASALPDNSIGRSCEGELRRHRVETNAIRFLPGRMGLYFLTHGAGVRPARVLYDRAASVFSLAPPDLFEWKRILANASWLHVSGITPAVSPMAAESALRATKVAREMGVRVSFDCNYRAQLWAGRAGEAPAVLRALLHEADHIFGTARDFELVLETTFDDGERVAIDAAFEAFPSLRSIAHTSRVLRAADVQRLGGMLHLRDGTFRSRPYALHGVVDRIGTGDAFAAAVLHGFLSGYAPQRTVDFATAAGCLKHTLPGDFSLFGVEEIESVLLDAAGDVQR